MAEGKRVRAAIVGAGLMGRWHADAVRRSGAIVTVIADNDAARATDLAQRFGAKSTTRFEEIFARDRADVVHVCTPADVRVEMISSALASGLHVLAEKPLAPSAATTAELYALASSKKLILCPVHQLLFQSGTLRILNDPEAIGTIRQLAVVICSAGADGADDRTHDRLALDILPHPLSLAWKALPGGLSAATWNASRAAAGEIHAHATVASVVLSILVSTHGRPTRNTLRLTGDLGTWHADLFHGFAFREQGSVSRLRKLGRPFAVASQTLASASQNAIRRALRTEPAFPGLRELVQRFYSAVSSGSAPPVSAEEAIGVAAARDTIIARLGNDGVDVSQPR
jgi:predicted dehydrogenase